MKKAWNVGNIRMEKLSILHLIYVNYYERNIYNFSKNNKNKYDFQKDKKNLTLRKSVMRH